MKASSMHVLQTYDLLELKTEVCQLVGPSSNPVLMSAYLCSPFLEILKKLRVVPGVHQLPFSWFRPSLSQYYPSNFNLPSSPVPASK